jgi:hypothetical protein
VNPVYGKVPVNWKLRSRETRLSIDATIDPLEEKDLYIERAYVK